jgi:hypothetical protein
MQPHLAISAALLIGLVGPWESASADEGGASFWLSGQYASLAAVPGTPGWSASATYYHDVADAGANTTFSRGGRIELGVNGRSDLVIVGPTYTFEQSLLGARPALGLFGEFGENAGSASAILEGPNGNPISRNISDSIFGLGDLNPLGTLAWNEGANNYMTYLTGNIPVGNYEPSRVSDVGLGHAALDAGAAYTHFNPDIAPEFSVTTGFTYNFINPDTQYRSGIDWHLDWGLSIFPTKESQAGLAGYFFQQISGDSGAGDRLGSFESRVAGVGPQVGYYFPVGDQQGYLNLRAYGEFAAVNRPDGWNVWLTLAITPKG